MYISELLNETTAKRPVNIWLETRLQWDDNAALCQLSVYGLNIQYDGKILLLFVYAT